MGTKYKLTSAIAAYILAGTVMISTSFAATSSTGDKGNSDSNNISSATNANSILSSIKASLQGSGFSLNTVSRKLDALLISTMEANANLMYQFDAYLTNANNTAEHLGSINQLVQADASDQTHTNVQAKLAEVPYTIMDSSNAAYKGLKTLLDQSGGVTETDRIKNLAEIDGTDTLGFSNTNNKPAMLFARTGLGTKMLLKTFDYGFDFDSLIQPQSYNTSAQMKAASNFITYLSKNYKISTSIDLSALKNDTKKLTSLKETPQYQTYLVNNRSNVAALSVPLSNFNQFYSERANLKSIITQLEKQGQPVNQTIKNVVNTLASQNINSLLELQNYVANHRISDKTWRKKMMSASPATVQRETLFVLAEMESQLQRIHIDNERLLATLSAAQLQMAQSMTSQPDTATRNLQSYISSKYGSDSSS
jgi:intracellular multiplication protein IcmX